MNNVKNRPKKVLLYSTFFVVVVVAFYASYSSLGAANKGNTTESKALMFEELPNGQSQPVVSSTIEKEKLKWLHNKQSELETLIAKQLTLEIDEVSVVLGPMSDIHHLACSVVLRTESTYEDQIIDKVLEGVISVISDDTGDTTISEDNIIIVNSKGTKLH